MHRGRAILPVALLLLLLLQHVLLLLLLVYELLLLMPQPGLVFSLYAVGVRKGAASARAHLYSGLE